MFHGKESNILNRAHCLTGKPLLETFKCTFQKYFNLTFDPSIINISINSAKTQMRKETAPTESMNQLTSYSHLRRQLETPLMIPSLRQRVVECLMITQVDPTLTSHQTLPTTSLMCIVEKVALATQVERNVGSWASLVSAHEPLPQHASD